MKQPTIGVYIATPGRKSIIRTLHSILTQRLLPGDDVLVVGDGYDKWTDHIVKKMGKPFRYVGIQQTRDWGHTQSEYGLHNVTGDLVVAQDDDDIFAPRAFESIREAALAWPNFPLMARVKTPGWGVLWSSPGVPPFDGHCLISPNIKEKLGHWTSAYDGDQDYMRTTLDHYFSVGWVDKVISLTRPTWKLWPSPVVLPTDVELLRRVRNSCREFMTRDTSEISVEQQKKWWESLDQEKSWYWLFYDNNTLLGYVGLKEEGDRMYATYGLRPEHRGKGYGKELVEFSCWAAQEELTIEVLVSNERALNLYKSKGFKEHWTKDGIMELYSEWPPRF